MPEIDDILSKLRERVLTEEEAQALQSHIDVLEQRSDGSHHSDSDGSHTHYHTHHAVELQIAEVADVEYTADEI